MSFAELDNLLRRFHRRINQIAAIRVLAILAVASLAVWSTWEPTQLDRRVAALLVAVVLAGWIVLALVSFHLARMLQMARILLGTGQTDNARVWLGRVMTGWSLSSRIQLAACQHLASSFSAKDGHEEVVSICRELLRHRLGRLKSVAVNTRLMLVDSLLMLDRVGEAYEALKPLSDLPLSLADRMKMLPIQLRYELRAGQPALAVESLSEKVRIAELLESPQAALVHAMLAKACRRHGMHAQAEFLMRRARLYADLAPLAQRYKVIADIAATDGGPDTHAALP
ncbi:MAG: hypothetical protein ACUVXJ_02095 [Phycisphaerae bacterium]